MGDIGVVVLAAKLAGLHFECGRGEPHSFAATTAYQVVLVRWAAADPIEGFSVLGTLSLGDPVLSKAAQDAVHAGQADGKGSALDLHVKLLCAAKVVALAQNLQYDALLGCRTPRFRSL